MVCLNSAFFRSLALVLLVTVPVVNGYADEAEESRASCAEEANAFTKKVYEALYKAYGLDKGQDVEKWLPGLFESLDKMLEQTVWFEVRQELIPRLVKEGQQAYDTGDYATALEKWQCALEVQQDVPQQLQGSPGAERAVELQHQFIAALHSDIGTVYTQLANYSEALNHYQQALSTYRAISDPKGKGKSLTNLGEMYLQLSRYPEALEHYQQALSRYQAVREQPGVGDVLSHIGEVYMGLGQYQKALEYAQQALAIHRALGKRREEGDDLRHLAMVSVTIPELSMPTSKPWPSTAS